MCRIGLVVGIVRVRDPPCGTGVEIDDEALLPRRDLSGQRVLLRVFVAEGHGAARHQDLVA